MRPRGRNVVLGCLFCLLVSAVASGAWAQDIDSAAETTAWQPLVFASRDGGIDLVEAVRLTLEQDPNLMLRYEDVITQEGRVLEQAGLFDWVFEGQVTWEHRQQELTDSVKKAEDDKRTQVADIEVVACEEEQALLENLEDLETAQTTPGTDIRNDVGFSAQLRLLEAAILSADTDAQREALEQTRTNLIQTEIAITQDKARDLGFACREAGATRERLGESAEEEEFDIGRLDLRFEKLTRYGVGWTPFFRGSYDSTAYVGKRDGYFIPATDSSGNELISPSGIPLEQLITFGGKDVEDLYNFELGFEVDLPLARGRGRDATGAGERAAQIDYEATELLLKHGASESVLNTLFAYWNLVAAEEQVNILGSSVELQERLVEISRALIDAEELPGTELHRALAGAENARAQLEKANSDLVTARMDLVGAMGFVVENEVDVPAAADTFPSAPERAALDGLEPMLTADAMSGRFDLRATRQLIESGLVLERQATTDLRPQFDLTLGSWMIARGQGSASNALDHRSNNVSWKVASQFEQPVGRHGAKGRLMQRESLVRQRQLSQADLERLIRIAVVGTLGSLAEATDQLGHAEKAAEAFESTWATELEKLKLGETTLIDAIITEQQWTSSRLSVILAKFQVATLISQLRFETGTLVESDDDGNRISEENLISVPGVAWP